MTKLGKCLVVFAVGASFAFLGFAWVSLMGGPNWDAEAAALPGYAIQGGDVPEGAWTVTERASGESVSVPASRVKASAVIEARRNLQKKQEAEIARLKAETDEYTKTLADVKKFNEADLKSLTARVNTLTEQLKAVNDKILNLSNDYVKRSQEAQAIRAEAAKRREDVLRLARELDEIRADNFRADELQKKLNDQLIRLDGAVTALEERNRQLRAEGGRTAPQVLQGAR